MAAVEENASALKLNREKEFDNLTSEKIKIGISNKRLELIENNDGKKIQMCGRILILFIAWNIINWFLAGPSAKDAKIRCEHTAKWTILEIAKHKDILH